MADRELSSYDDSLSLSVSISTDSTGEAGPLGIEPEAEAVGVSEAASCSLNLRFIAEKE